MGEKRMVRGAYIILFEPHQKKKNMAKKNLGKNIDQKGKKKRNKMPIFRVFL